MSTPGTGPEAGIYLRLSSDPGNDERGVARQKKHGLKFCEAMGWTPVVYEDNDTSATSGVDRPQYTALLQDMEAGRLRAVWSWGHDRLTRDPDAEFPAFMNLARKNGVLFGDRNGVKDLSRGSDRYNARNAINAAALEIDNMKERQQEAFNQLAGDGLAFWSHRPFGYTKPVVTNFERTPPQQIPEEAALIREAYTAVLDGRSLRSIVREWNEKGYRTPTREISAKAKARNPGAAGGNLWVPLNLRQLLLSPRNAGLRQRTRTEKVNGKQRIISREIVDTPDGVEWEAIVTPELWRGVVAKLTSRARTPDAWSRKYLMSGLAICGVCDHRMTSSVRATSKVATYICRHCMKTRRSVPRVDLFVTAVVALHLEDQEAVREKLSAGVDTVALRSELLELDKRQKNMAQGVKIGLMTVDEIAGDFAEIRTRRAEIDTLLEAQPRIPAPVERLLDSDDIARDFDAMSLDDRRTVVSTLFTLTILPGQPGGNAPFDKRYVRVDSKL